MMITTQINRYRKVWGPLDIPLAAHSQMSKLTLITLHDLAMRMKVNVGHEKDFILSCPIHFLSASLWTSHPSIT